MFEKLKIRYLGHQPSAIITSKKLDKIIQRDYGENFKAVKQKLELLKSSSSKGRNRLSAAVLKLANGEVRMIDKYIEMCNNDFRDVILEAEYPRISKLDFIEADNIAPKKIREYYLEDWTDYTNWVNKP